MQKWRKDLNTYFFKKEKQMDNKHMKRFSVSLLIMEITKR